MPSVIKVSFVSSFTIWMTYISFFLSVLARTTSMLLKRSESGRVVLWRLQSFTIDCCDPCGLVYILEIFNLGNICGLFFFLTDEGFYYYTVAPDKKIQPCFSAPSPSFAQLRWGSTCTTQRSCCLRRCPLLPAASHHGHLPGPHPPWWDVLRYLQNPGDADGLCVEVEGKMVSKREDNTDDSLIGGIVSAEVPKGRVPESFTKEAYRKFIKDYTKSIKGKFEKQRPERVKFLWQGLWNKSSTNFNICQFSSGENMHPGGIAALLACRENRATPWMILF